MQRSRAIELMFLDFQALSSNEFEDVELNYDYEKNVNNIRSRYGLKPIDEKATGLENLFDANITSALEIKIENEMEIPLHETTLDEREFHEEREFIDEETIEDEESEIEEYNEDSNFKEESEDSMNFKEEEEDSISDELEEKVKRKRKERKADDDQEIFE
jgi:hypothetical protein